MSNSSNSFFPYLIGALVLNFAALGIGGLLMDGGVTSDWYTNANQAPWTPPGAVFGIAWTTIMICFSVYLAGLTKVIKPLKVAIIPISIQWILNIIWNPIFFKYHQTELALIAILALAGIVIHIYRKFLKEMGAKSWLLMPYIVWLLIAISLNAYFVIYN